MGQKVSPIGMRVGVIRDWQSRWYADDKEFGTLLMEDVKIREFVEAYYAKLQTKLSTNVRQTLKSLVSKSNVLRVV